jgi:hypothetical protein
MLQSIAGRTSDEIWPRLEEIVVHGYGVSERKIISGDGDGSGGLRTASHKAEHDIDISSVGIIDKGSPKNVRASSSAATS